MREWIELGGGWHFEPLPHHPGFWQLHMPSGRSLGAESWPDENARLFAAAIRPQVKVEAEEELCALIFNNLEASVDFVAGKPIAVLGSTQAAARAVLDAGYRKPTPAPPPQTSGSVPDEIVRAIDALGNAAAFHGGSEWTKARAHLDALILAHVTRPSTTSVLVEAAYKAGYHDGAASYIGEPDSDEDMRLAQQQSWEIHRSEFSALPLVDIPHPDAILRAITSEEMRDRIAEIICDHNTNGNYLIVEIPEPQRFNIESAALHALTAVAEALRPMLGTGGQSKAVQDVLAERKRQVEAEGWTPEHDDMHDTGALALAAAAYAYGTQYDRSMRKIGARPNWWPWDARWWKPTNPYRDLVKAGALILAELDRLNRAAPPTQEPPR